MTKEEFDDAFDILCGSLPYGKLTPSYVGDEVILCNERGVRCIIMPRETFDQIMKFKINETVKK